MQVSRGEVNHAKSRESCTHPILEKIKAWLDEKALKALPKGLLGMAIAYTLNLWSELNTYVYTIR